jgi:mRNA (2'-O-methyladenosine-N6-)-methyltransferase
VKPKCSAGMNEPQWINCDIRHMDLTTLGKYSVIMADPPWDIHMELPYGTMKDEEMRNLRIQDLSDDGLFFLWVTGRAMELGRELLRLWGYTWVDEITWVKVNLPYELNFHFNFAKYSSSEAEQMSRGEDN